MSSPDIRIRASAPAIAKVRGARACEACGGIGHRVKRIYRRRNGRISRIVYDGDQACSSCGGSGEK